MCYIVNSMWPNGVIWGYKLAGFGSHNGLYQGAGPLPCPMLTRNQMYFVVLVNLCSEITLLKWLPYIPEAKMLVTTMGWLACITSIHYRISVTACCVYNTHTIYGDKEPNIDRNDPMTLIWFVFPSKTNPVVLRTWYCIVERKYFYDDHIFYRRFTFNFDFANISLNRNFRIIIIYIPKIFVSLDKIP